MKTPKVPDFDPAMELSQKGKEISIRLYFNSEDEAKKVLERMINDGTIEDFLESIWDDEDLCKDPIIISSEVHPRDIN